MFEIIETTNGKFESVGVFDNLSVATHEVYWLRKENPSKDYTIYNEQGLEI